MFESPSNTLSLSLSLCLCLSFSLSLCLSLSLSLSLFLSFSLTLSLHLSLSLCLCFPTLFDLYQGARLTAFEIIQDGLPGTLIADSMASALMAVKGVDCVVVGADRVAANG